eukprot:TRINITY_DN9000_c0_g1_i1.p2 TRINITY_DN9000_c0_g1~~TRINITY_DN9000_c0_g1_i1.p2  ORF type:complete len:188 (-),score=41.44 TRINITY_DN9000_c0_g1_i1:227-790(-)
MYLGLEKNQIDDAGVQSLMSDLQSNSTLTHVDLKQNLVTREGVFSAKMEAHAGAYPRTIDLRESGLDSEMGVLFTTFAGADGTWQFIGMPEVKVQRSRSAAQPKVEKKTSAKSLAGYIMKQADRHCRNGRLTLNELQTFLPRHGFTRWMSKNRGQMFKVDRNRDGSIGIEELRQACSQFLEEEADRS